MRTRAAFVIGAGVGFLAGTPAGRRQIERITARLDALLGEEGPWAGRGRSRTAGSRSRTSGGRPAVTLPLSSKVVEAARAAARAAAAVAPRIVRPPRPSERQMSYRLPAQRSHADRDWDGDGDGDGQANAPTT